MSYLHFTPTNQELTVSILELIRSVGSDGHYNSVHHTFRLRRIPVRLRRFFDVVHSVCLGQEPYFICKPSTALSFTPTDDPEDKDPLSFFQALHRNFHLIPKPEYNYPQPDFTKVDFIRYAMGPVPAEDRWVLTFMEPLHSKEISSPQTYRLEQYKAFFYLSTFYHPSTFTAISEDTVPTCETTASWTSRRPIKEFVPSSTYQ